MAVDNWNKASEGAANLSGMFLKSDRFETLKRNCLDQANLNPEMIF